jgi:pimeloyl-ACP methyl ester carboxylesterase
MATFILVHGGWDGGWFWRPAARLLQADGHEVFTATLIGSGERAHLASPDVTLDTHITDIVNVLEYEDLSDVVLVGRSYAGLVITGLAQRDPERLRRLVYLDALLPMEGRQSWACLIRHRQPAIAARAESEIRASGARYVLPPPSSPRLFGITNADDLDWVQHRLTPQPAGTWFQSVGADPPPTERMHCTYIDCPLPGESATSPSGAHARQEGWGYHVLSGGHDVMVTMPAELSALLGAIEGA